MGSPTPRRTVVITGVRARGDGDEQQTGLGASLFDFGGELTDRPLERATMVRVTPRAYHAGEFVSFEVTAVFDGGTITGGVFARHCDSLD